MDIDVVHVHVHVTVAAGYTAHQESRQGPARREHLWGVFSSDLKGDLTCLSASNMCVCLCVWCIVVRGVQC